MNVEQFKERIANAPQGMKAAIVFDCALAYYKQGGTMIPKELNETLGLSPSYATELNKARTYIEYTKSSDSLMKVKMSHKPQLDKAKENLGAMASKVKSVFKRNEEPQTT